MGMSKGARAQSRPPVLLSVLLASTMLTSVTAARADSTSTGPVDPNKPGGARDTSSIETVVVTAEKRTEDLQKVAASVQVLGNQKLQDLHITNFSDYAQYLPSVSFSANAAGGGLNGPGFANVYMRGVASGGDGNHSASLPSVGIYLDEEPITTIGGAPDIHVYDIARVEVLAGPQGTLYGASSEAGTIRIITNQPDPTGFSASYDLSANTIARGTGSLGGEIEGYVNIPLSDDAAIRIVAWEEHDAGYISNVDGTDAAAGIVNGVRMYPVSGNSIDAVNVRNNYNTTDILGARAALRIDLDANWTVTSSLIGQMTQANGSFAFDPAVGDLKVVKFTPEFTRDHWYQAALTVQGKIADLDVTYAYAHMDRWVHSQIDYSDYSFFYNNVTNGSGTPLANYFNEGPPNTKVLIDPSQKVIGFDHFQKDSHELRVASPSEDRLRFVAGLFYQRQFHAIIQDYVIDEFPAYDSVTGWQGAFYLADEDRVDTDYAAFTEISYRVLPSFTITAGGRLFESDNSLKGFFGFSANFENQYSYFSPGMNQCFPGQIIRNGPCTDLNSKTDEKGFTHKLNGTWQIDDDAMVYFTWSNGFRPGGVNRIDSGSPYKPDYLINYEIGWKTAWLDDTLTFNGDLYLDNWKNFQFTFLSTNSIPVIANAGEAQILGAEGQVAWRATDHLTIDGSAAYTDAELTQPYCKDPHEPCPATSPPYPIGNPILAAKGQQLPITPRFKANATARYDFNLYSFDAHVQGSVVYNGSSWDDLRSIERAITGKDPAYTMFNFTTGIGKDDWMLELSIENMFDERAQLYRYSECTPDVCGPQTLIIPSRPRTFGLRFSQQF